MQADDSGHTVPRQFYADDTPYIQNASIHVPNTLVLSVLHSLISPFKYSFFLYLKCLLRFMPYTVQIICINLLKPSGNFTYDDQV
jgi:hypothetical protein